jgi:chromate transporter
MTVSYSDLTRSFGKIGLLSFGGPAAQIALMHRELVDDRKWLDEDSYLRALSFCMLLPGPEAMQLATYAGWRLRGIPGGLIAGGLFVLPGAVLIFALAYAYAAFGDLPLVQAAFLGIKAAVIAIVIEALIRISRRALKGRGDLWIAGFGFAALFLFGLPFPLVILAAALWGATRTAPAPTLAPAAGRLRAGPALIFLALWALPFALLLPFGQSFLLQVATLFSTLAVVTFGGAYAVLAYLAQVVVQDLGWLTAPEMVDALGLAETTPGPLILVTQFVATLAGIKSGGPMLGLLAGLLALWVTFIPCFLWIFAFAPWIDRLTSAPRLQGALKAITAAVVGVIANLSLWFALHVLFGTVTRTDLGPLHLSLPDPATLDPRAAALTFLAAYLLLRRHLALPLLLATLAAAGVAISAL